LLYDQDHPADGVRRGHLDALAAYLPEQSAQAGVCCQVHGEAFESLGDWVTRVVRHSRYPAAVEILHDHALEQVVDVVHLETQFHMTVPINGTVTLEVADATGIQYDFREG